MSRHVLWVVIATSLGCSRVADLSPDPYALVAESAFRNRAIAAPCEVEITDEWSVFGDVRLTAPTIVVDRIAVGPLAARYARFDSGARFHGRGVTTLEQLATLTTSDFERALADARDARTKNLTELHTWKRPGAGPAANASASFLLYHATALRLAAEATTRGPEDASWTLALAHEAAALGYLLDAMSADRMNTPPDRGPFFHLSRNRSASSTYFGNGGLFVLNADGEVWQSFGRKHVEWFRTHLCHVMDAARRAVRELYFVFHVANGHSLPDYLAPLVENDHAGRTGAAIARAWLEGRDGSAWLEEERLPSLRALPAPIRATWRVKTGDHDELGVRPTTHYPQVNDVGLYDPTLVSDTAPFGDTDTLWHAALDRRDLRRPGSFPSWRSPRSILGGADPWTRVLEDPDLASVSFVQRNAVSPSVEGAFLSGSLTGVTKTPLDREGMAALGAGGLWRTRLGLALWTGAHVEYAFPDGDGGGKSLSTNAVLAASSNPFRPSAWVEVGAIWDLAAPIHHGWAYKLLWLPGTIALPFSYAGLTPAIEIGVRHTDAARGRFGVGLLFH